MKKLHLWKKVVTVHFVCTCGKKFKHRIEAINHCAREQARG